MVDQAKASQLARSGFDLWQAGHLAAAAAMYREALACADPDHYALQDYHGEFGGVLAALGQDAEAREQFELALRHARRSDAGGEGPSVQVARYFLGEHLVRMGLAAEALPIVQAASDTTSKQLWLLRFVEAKALWATGRGDEARATALVAIGLAPNDDRRNVLREELAFILEQAD